MRKIAATIAVSVIAFGLSGCGGGDGGSPTQPESETTPTATTISVSPGSATAIALQDTTDFSATVRDQSGSAMSGVSVSWSSTDASVATVTSQGEAVAQVNGTAQIVASAGGLADTAKLNVDQRADQVTVSPAEDSIGVGATIQLSAEAVDGNDHAIADAEFAWSSSDTSVASVDSEGLVQSQSDGVIQISAELDGSSAASTLTVGTGAASGATLEITEVNPSPMPEGGQVTLSGSGFASDPASNTVTVDGVTAQVTSSTATSLELDVPLFDCQPAREVVIEVTTSEGSGSTTTPLAPDEEVVDLASGEGGLISNPDSFCLQFEETSGTEQYVVGVQSTSRTVSSLTPVQVIAEADNGASADLRPSMSLAVEKDQPRIDGGHVPSTPEWLARHRAAEQEIRRKSRRLLQDARLAGQGEGEEEVSPSFSVGPGVSVGDLVSMRVPDTSTESLCTSYTEIGARVKAIGTEAIIVADTANPANGFSDADYQDFADWIDDKIFAKQVEYFGQPTDIDGNGGIVALFTKEVNRTAPNSLGFVIAADLFPRTDCATSDEGEVFYGKVPDPNGTFGSSWATSDARGQIPFIMSHELTHVIQNARRLLSGNPLLDQWLAEAQATLSEEVVGHDVTERGTGNNYGSSVAFSEDSDGIEWYFNGFFDLFQYFGFESSSSRIAEAPDQCGWWREDASPCVARALWYGVGWTFLRWVSDHYGSAYAGGEAELHRAIVDADQGGWATIEQVTGEDFDALLAAWSVALYVDDRISGADAAFTMPSWNLKDLEDATVASAHLQPFEAGFSDWTASGDIRASSAGYVLLEGSGRPATAVRVRGSGGGVLPSSMQVWIVRLE